MAIRVKEGVEDFHDFSDWKEVVDCLVQELTGLSCDDLPKQPYHDWFDAGLSTKQAARLTIKQAELLRKRKDTQEKTNDG